MRVLFLGFLFALSSCASPRTILSFEPINGQSADQTRSEFHDCRRQGEETNFLIKCMEDKKYRFHAEMSEVQED